MVRTEDEPILDNEIHDLKQQIEAVTSLPYLDTSVDGFDTQSYLGAVFQK